MYIDDADLDVHLRKSSIPVTGWSQNVYKAAFESRGTPEEVIVRREQILKEAGILFIHRRAWIFFFKIKASRLRFTCSSLRYDRLEPLYSMSQHLGSPLLRVFQDYLCPVVF